MHIDFIAEGIKKDLDEFEKWMETRVLPLEVKDKEGNKIPNQFVQSILRPRRAYSLVIPRESLDAVLNTLNLNPHIALHDGKGTKVFSKLITPIRKLLRLNKIPKADETKGRIAIPEEVTKNIRLLGLGIRDDIDIQEADGRIHEGL